ncbi:sugar transferase [Enterococcus italicus]
MHFILQLTSEKDVNNRQSFLFTKRLIDIIGSIVGLIGLSPIMVWAAYKIKQEENGSPVFFIQERVGKNGKTFKMYKFRSMCMDAEQKLIELIDQNEVEGAMFKIKEDPRVTKIGKKLRKTSIDELPQLWNVLKGEMSLIGPRPSLPREFELYDEYDKQRLLVKPGCSGLWQVSGRNEIHFKGMVDLDIKYIKNQSILEDTKIIIKTILIITKPNGA